MPTKPKQQRADNQAHLREAVIRAFEEWCALEGRAPNEAAAAEFTADMDGTFQGATQAELMAFIRSSPRFQR